MCVIIVKDKGAKLSDQLIDDAWRRNGQGAGFCFIPKNKPMIVLKGIMELDKLKEKLGKIDLDEGKLIIHFRIQSRGGVNPDLTHPFDCTEDGSQKRRFLFHNGTVRCISNPASSSDSSYLAETFLKNLDDDSVIALLKNLSKKGFGRFVFVYGTKVEIIGDAESIKKDGLWLSNTRHEQKNGPIPIIGDGAYDEYTDWQGYGRQSRENWSRTFEVVDNDKDKDDDTPLTPDEVLNLANSVGRKTALANHVDEADIEAYIQEIITDHEIMNWPNSKLNKLKALDQKYQHPLLEYYKKHE